jgi:hypothetical protein
MAAVTLAVVSGCSVTSPALGPGTTGAAARTSPPNAAPSALSSTAGVRVDPSVANLSLSTRAREHGRTEVMLCLYVDPSTGSDGAAALTSLQRSVDAPVLQGYTVLGARPVALCLQAPWFIRTNTGPRRSSAPETTAGR